jgi:hypothetical protein
MATRSGRLFRTERPAGAQPTKGPPMSYATPFYYAAKAVQTHESPSRNHHPLPTKQRRRRIRLVLFPAQRPTVAPATSSDC